MPSLESFRKTHPHCHPQQVGCLLADFVHFASFCIILPGKFWYMHKMKGLLEKNDIPTFLCEPVPGKDIVEVTKDGLIGTRKKQTFSHGGFLLGNSLKGYESVKHLSSRKGQSR